MAQLITLPTESPDTPAENLWSYMRERLAIKQRRDGKLPPPWTADTILQTYKFTNVYRSDDFTTRGLSQIYEKHKDAPLDLALLNAATFRYFGHLETCQDIGWQNGLDEEHILTVVHNRKAAGLQVFTGAYVITNGGIKKPKEEVVVQHYLRGLWEAIMADNIAVDAVKRDSWAWLTGRMGWLDGFGGTGFMTKETLLDTFLFHWKPADYKTFTPIGPGARRGLNRLFQRDLNTNKAAFGDEIKSLHTIIDGKQGFEFTMHDIQFSLCEYDKYCRVAYGQGKPRSKFKPRSQ